jgi:ATP-dependent helicase/nuclease subunit A
MSALQEVSARTARQQEIVSDPAVSAWVSANAGAGKTTVLVRRVIRLLLDGNAPARILCLTFTKAAAVNMANKVLKTLSKWVRLGDGELDAAIREISPLPVTPALRARARRLFAAAIETPGGLKVQTIHAFCDRVLHQFPFEAGVPAGFEVLDEVREADLLARARKSVLVDAANAPDSALGRALAHAIAVAGDLSLEQALIEAVRERSKIERLHEIGGDEAIAAALGLRPSETVAAVEQAILDGAILARSDWSSIAASLLPYGGNARSTGRRLAEAAAETDPCEAIDRYLLVFFTKDGEPRADTGFGAASARGKASDLFTRLFLERERLIPLRNRRLAAQARERTAALLTLAEATIKRYEAEKRARGALDYADLIDKTAAMFDDTGANWILYKLDGGIDHVLIDEAQDTSPTQWRVISRLTEEFFAGEGAREAANRTIFAVGDEKQSIFSFQGADPREFDQMRRAFEQRVRAAGHEFEQTTLDLSFRSAPGVLAAIDRVFSRAEAYGGLSCSGGTRTVHEAIRKAAPALVEIWPIEPAPPDDDAIAWSAPLDARSESSAVERLARHIAAAVTFWLGGGIVISDRGSGELRVPRAGDVIVLVRQRGPLFHAILQALKRARVEVAGADRLALTEHIAVMDLMALGDALLLEADDLALACALKSPLLGLGEDDLFALAHDRKGTLAASLRDKARTEPRFKKAAEKLERWRSEASELRPFDFYSRVLGRDEGRALMLARLGMEAADALDEFLARALTYEQTETASLPGFLAFLRRATTEVKRDLEVESDAVRVMTVHGAKGLEAPIIVLAETTSMPDGRQDAKLLTLPQSEAFVWALGAKSDSSKLAAARDAAAEARAAEYRRLLYVALTRAADALIVCGHQQAPVPPQGCWYQLVHEALKEELVEGAAPGFEGTVGRWRADAMKRGAPSAAPAHVRVARPAWLSEKAPPPPTPVARIRPSRLDANDERVTPFRRPASGALDPRRRGDLLHRLLQWLPALPLEERGDGASRLLAGAAGDLSQLERDALVAEARRVVEHPELAELFGRDSQAEVDVIANAGTHEIVGRIDRLAVTPERVVIADFKTGSPPANAGAAPAEYVRQLALYSDVLARIYPYKAMCALLVWTAGPAIHRIDAPQLGSASADALRLLTPS